MPTLTLTEKQLRLIQSALDFYSRVGIGQMWAIKDHPTYQQALYEKLRPKKKIEVGDITEQGEVIEVGSRYIKTRGVWIGKEEVRKWKPNQVKLSVNYEEFHNIRDAGEKQLNIGRNTLLCEEMLDNSSWGIHHPNVDESCREAFDIIQVIRHEFWKANPDRSDITVDSSIHFIASNSNSIKCEL